MDEINEELFAYIVWRAQELTECMPPVEPQCQEDIDVNWAYVDRQARSWAEQIRKNPAGSTTGSDRKYT